MFFGKGVPPAFVEDLGCDNNLPTQWGHPRLDIVPRFNVTRFSSLGLVAAFLVVFSGCGFAQESFSEILKTLSGIKQLSMPIGPDASKPTMIFSCESVAIERRSVGFFKIGILPEIVLCDVKIRIMNSPEPTTWVEQLAAFFASEKSQSIKIRNLKIETRDGRYYLAAAEAFIPSLEKGFLLKQVEVSGENLQSRSAKALILLQGVHLGKIIFTGSYTDVLSMSDSSIVSQQSGEPPTTLP